MFLPNDNGIAFTRWEINARRFAERRRVRHERTNMEKALDDYFLQTPRDRLLVKSQKRQKTVLRRDRLSGKLTRCWW